MSYVVKFIDGKFLGTNMPIKSFSVEPSDKMTYFYDIAKQLVAAVRTDTVDYIVAKEIANDFFAGEMK